MARKKKPAPGNQIVQNKKAGFDYALQERMEAGIVLEGWEVKSLRAGRVQLRDSYVLLKDGEAWLLGAHIVPLPTASTHVNPQPDRTRKLLLHRGQIDSLIGAVERRGFTVVPTRMYWKKGRAKVELATAKGKQKHDKRAAEKEKDWQRDRQRIMKDYR